MFFGRIKLSIPSNFGLVALESQSGLQNNGRQERNNQRRSMKFTQTMYRKIAIVYAKFRLNQISFACSGHIFIPIAQFLLKHPVYECNL